MATTTPSRVASSTGGAGSAKDDAAAPEAKKSKKKLIIIAVVLLVGGGGYYKMSAKAPAKDAAPVPGVVIAMDATTLNLADGHFLKLKLALQTVKGADAALDTSKAADIAVNEFTNRPMASLATTAARTAVKADLVAKLKVAYPKEIMDVYFTQFVMQ